MKSINLKSSLRSELAILCTGLAHLSVSVDGSAAPALYRNASDSQRVTLNVWMVIGSPNNL